SAPSARSTNASAPPWPARRNGSAAGWGTPTPTWPPRPCCTAATTPSACTPRPACAPSAPPSSSAGPGGRSERLVRLPPLEVVQRVGEVAEDPAPPRAAGERVGPAAGAHRAAGGQLGGLGVAPGVGVGHPGLEVGDPGGVADPGPGPARQDRVQRL